MARTRPVFVAPILFAAALVLSATARAQEAKPGDAPSKITTNQSVIEGLANTLDLANNDAVFAHVFGQLPDQVIVYPSENYYYWSFFANGRPIWGNFRLDAADRDQGVVHFGYFEYDENGKFQDVDGWEKTFGGTDGVEVKKLERFAYSIAYKGKTVVFRLFELGMAPPKKAKLRPDEVYIGPVYDESGVCFFLIFNTAENHFSYLLNEEVPAAETYKNLKPHLLVGRRTGFAYYVDKDNDRKFLVAAFAPNVQRNNYYDGPFDQAPDNYVDETHIQKYLELAYPSTKGRIDKFGHFIGEKGVRAGVFAYYSYFDERELDFVDVCLRMRHTPAKLYACITPDPQQRNGVPPIGARSPSAPKRP